MAVYSIYVEKKPIFAAETQAIWKELHEALALKTVTGIRVLSRYLVDGLEAENFQSALNTIFSHPKTDDTYMGMPRNTGKHFFGMELLSSQFDQRADSCAAALALAFGGERPTVRYARIFVLLGEVDPVEEAAIKNYLINPVESREISLDMPTTLNVERSQPAPVPRVEGFMEMDKAALAQLKESYGIAMELDDLEFCWEYFTKTEQRNPTETEIRMIDTYWSDHCRHTTFFTHLDEFTVEDSEIKQAQERYFALREKLYPNKNRPVTLMDLATIGAKALKADGILTDVDESEEVNACSVKITVDVDGQDEEWLLMFKNETHNHPTEIEPFGGASTCLGGAIRDPLSGRSYSYQAMRIIGAGNPLTPVSETLAGKLPQRTLAQTAAEGYSSYGNQIGLATGHVHEIYHDGYVAKRMELGAIMAAVPANHVVREVPTPGDVVILIGGKTGKDGVGGATGSSQSHSLDSAEESGAEVQKGNAPEERKIVRLFRDGEISRMIKRSNDFGAGGVSVAIGELADGVHIYLDAVPTKFEGMSGTEIAISESQERMAVVVGLDQAERFIQRAKDENLEATIVAEITEEPRLVMEWQNDTIVDISREFLGSSGVSKHTTARVVATTPWEHTTSDSLNGAQLRELLSSIKHSSQKGLVERFDSTAGGNTVLMPYGGRHQLTPAQSMVAKIPLIQGKTNTASVMAWGYDPVVSSHSPYHGALLAVVDSVAKMIAAGGTRRKSWLTFQEYFERLGNDPTRWGKPAAALLGALTAQLELGIGAIGGKDSMSGSFEDLDVPPTLVSFAVSVAKAKQVVSGEFKQVGNPVYHLAPTMTDALVPDFDSLRALFDQIETLLLKEKIKSIYTIGAGGVAKAIPLMCFGNGLGCALNKPLSARSAYGSFVVELSQEEPALAEYYLGQTIEEYVLALPNEAIDLAELEQAWLGTLEPIYNMQTTHQGRKQAESYSYETRKQSKPKEQVERPQVLLPVFPGTNGEYEVTKAFERAGAKVRLFIIKDNQTVDLQKSYGEFARALATCQMLAIPGGMSGGGEPEGSGKLIAAYLWNPVVKEAVEDLLNNRDGLICGIGEGFHALLQVGLLPFGEYRPLDLDSPALITNTIGRFQAKMVRTRMSSNRSPWLSAHEVGEIFGMPVAGKDGRLVMTQTMIDRLAASGQIASQYVDLEGNPTEDIRFNPSGSVDAIEALSSPDGRIFGRMAYPERTAEEDIYNNLPRENVMDMFQGAVNYFR